MEAKRERTLWLQPLRVRGAGEEWDEGERKEMNERRSIYSVEGKHSDGGRKDGMRKEGWGGEGSRGVEVD